MTNLREKIIMKHNPGFLPKDELLASFVVRHAELASVLETVRNNTTASNQHVLVIGRRGMGKTMLVHRVALAIERDPALASRWYPIVFGEEAYHVSNAGELWLEALHQLAAQTGEQRWHDVHVQLRREQDAVRLRDLALARLCDFADERKVRLLIAVENLQDVLGTQMVEAEGWVLRHTLLNEPRIMMLATATARFDDIDKPKKAAYELFATLHLRPLTGEEIRAVWEALTNKRLDPRAGRVIEIFTGGNPRLLVVLASLARGRPLREFMTELLGLIDDHSDYFKSNLEALPIDERRAFVALCELWDPSTARSVGEVARFNVNKASMLLGRLVAREAVEVVQVRGRAKYYQAAERMYGIFHRLRRSATRDNRAASVVEFIARFYMPERLPEFAMRFAAEVCGEVPANREDHLLVLEQLIQRGAVSQEIVEQDAAVGLRLIDLLIAQKRVAEADVFADEWLSHRPVDVAALSAKCRVSLALDRPPMDEMRVFSGIPPSDWLLLESDEWVTCVAAVDILGRSPTISLAKAIESSILQLGVSLSERNLQAIVICLALSPYTEVVAVAAECDRRRHQTDSLPHHVKFAVMREDFDDALERLGKVVVDHPNLLGQLLDFHRDALLRLAVERPEGLHAIACTIPLFEPLAFALAQELGHDVLAPPEVTEVAKDIRAELRALRGATYSATDEPLLAAAEGPPPKKRGKKKPTRRQPKKLRR